MYGGGDISSTAVALHVAHMNVLYQCVHVVNYTYICVQIFTHIHINIRIHLPTCIPYICVHTHTYIYIYIYIYTYIYIYIRIYIYNIYIYIPASLNSMIGGGDICSRSGISICTYLHIYTYSIRHVYMQSYYTTMCVNTHTYTYT